MNPVLAFEAKSLLAAPWNRDNGDGGDDKGEERNDSLQNVGNRDLVVYKGCRATALIVVRGIC